MSRRNPRNGKTGWWLNLLLAVAAWVVLVGLVVATWTLILWVMR